jgi:hypothetical protein
LYELYGVPAPEEPPPAVRRVAASRPAPRVAAVPPAAPPAAPKAPAEPEQMIMIRGAVKNVQVFAREQQEAK